MPASSIAQKRLERTDARVAASPRNHNRDRLEAVAEAEAARAAAKREERLKRWGAAPTDGSSAPKDYSQLRVSAPHPDTGSPAKEVRPARESRLSAGHGTMPDGKTRVSISERRSSNMTQIRTGCASAMVSTSHGRGLRTGVARVNRRGNSCRAQTCRVAAYLHKPVHARGHHHHHPPWGCGCA